MPIGNVVGSSVGYSVYEGGSCSLPPGGASAGAEDEDEDGRPTWRYDAIVRVRLDATRGVGNRVKLFVEKAPNNHAEAKQA